MRTYALRTYILMWATTGAPCKPHLCTHTYVHSVVHGNTDICNYVGTYLSGLLHICTYVRTYMVVGHAGHSYVCHIDDVWLGCITLYIPVWPLSYDSCLPSFDMWHFHLSYSIVTDHWKSTGWKAGQIKQWCESMYTIQSNQPTTPTTAYTSVGRHEVTNRATSELCLGMCKRVSVNVCSSLNSVTSKRTDMLCHKINPPSPPSDDLSWY